jgi:hypothetical protein
VTRFSKLDVDFFAYRALIVVVEDVSVSLPDGVPGWDLCHQGACLAGVAFIDHGPVPHLCSRGSSGFAALPDVVNLRGGFVHQ